LRMSRKIREGMRGNPSSSIQIEFTAIPYLRTCVVPFYPALLHSAYIGALLMRDAKSPFSRRWRNLKTPLKQYW